MLKVVANVRAVAQNIASLVSELKQSLVYNQTIIHCNKLPDPKLGKFQIFYCMIKVSAIRPSEFGRFFLQQLYFSQRIMNLNI